jgi:hypothetical protein
MKLTLLPIRIFVFFLLLSLCHAEANSQISVVSTTGYAVNIDVSPSAIQTNATSCAYGYSYMVQLKYNITLSGSNIPASLYTLQGTVGCGVMSSFFDLPNGAGSGFTVSSNSYTAASNCATASVNSMRCNTIIIEISGPGISQRFVTYSVAAPLSVKLVSFTAAADNNRVRLNWATASETNNSYFTTERSADGAQWEAINKIAGAGNSGNITTYQSYDESPLSGTNYYRLKQTDFDGTSAYSSVQAVTYTASAKTISLYPVPNTGNTITIKGLTDYKNHELAVINASGAMLFSTSMSKASVDLPALQPGLYIIRLTNKLSGEAQNLRYVKI